MATAKTTAATKPPKNRPVGTPAAYPKKGNSRKHFDIDEDLSKKLKVYAAMHGMTMKEVVSAALDAFLNPKGGRN